MFNIVFKVTFIIPFNEGKNHIPDGSSDGSATAANWKSLPSPTHSVVKFLKVYSVIFILMIENQCLCFVCLQYYRILSNDHGSYK